MAWFHHFPFIIRSFPEIFPDTYVSCAVRAEQFGDWTSHFFVDFDEYSASRFKVAA